MMKYGILAAIFLLSTAPVQANEPSEIGQQDTRPVLGMRDLIQPASARQGSSPSLHYCIWAFRTRGNFPDPKCHILLRYPQ